MSSDQDFDRIVRDWLEIGPTQLSDRVTEAARLGIGRTKQRRALGRNLPWPASRSGRLIAIGGAIVLVLAGILGLRVLQDRPAIGGPRPTPSAPAATTAPSASAQVPARLVVRFHPRSTESAHPDAADMAKIRDIVLRRLEAAGFADPVVTIGDRNFVSVDFPLGTDWKQVRALLEQRGVLTFVPLPADTYGTSSTTAGPIGVTAGRPLPVDAGLKPLFTGAAITTADRTSDQNGSPAVQFELDEPATKLFAAYTTDHVGDYFAIVLDGTVLAVPSVSSPVADGSVVVALAGGADAATQASELASFLRTGALPFKLDWSGTETSPSASP